LQLYSFIALQIGGIAVLQQQRGALLQQRQQPVSFFAIKTAACCRQRKISRTFS
jgi:hypothetical protein